MIPLKQFLTGINQNVGRINKYQLGHDGSDGTCDCIGLIIGALRLCGFKWPGTHGSNWTARNAMRTLKYISSQKDCFLGEIVFKAKEPGEDGYSLPSSYQNSSDKRDYYHVGVVTGINPFIITHCTGVQGGIKTDNSLGKWHYGGELKYVDYQAEDKPMDIIYKAIVTAETGKTVRMRQSPNVNGRIETTILVGTEVKVLEEVDANWAKILYGYRIGYMNRTFLKPIGTEPTEDVSAVELLQQAIEKMEQAIDLLTKR